MTFRLVRCAGCGRDGTDPWERRDWFQFAFRSREEECAGHICVGCFQKLNLYRGPYWDAVNPPWVSAQQREALP